MFPDCERRKICSRVGGSGLIRKITLPVLVLALAALSACGDGQPGASGDSAEASPQNVAIEQDGIRWFDGGVEEAFAAARAQQKPVFLYWGEEWCPFCNRLEETVFKRDEFIALSHDFIALYLGTDTEEKIEYGERFAIRGFPTVIVLDPDGNTLTRIAGGTDMEQYAQVLETTLGEVRPVGELVGSVQSGGELSPGEWTLLANYAWRDEPGRALQEDADLHAVLQLLSDKAPADVPRVKHRLTMWAFSAWLNDDDRDMSLGPGYYDYSTAVMADEALMRGSLGAIARDGDKIIQLVTPADQQAEVRDRILREINTALEDPDTVTLRRIELLMGWLNVSTAMLGEEETLSDEQLEWMRQQTAAARHELPKEQLHSGLYFLSRIYRQLGFVDEARDVARQGIEETPAPYYFMIGLAGLEKDQGNLDEALVWYEKAWEASRGPRTRVRWGWAYLNNLVEISPENVPAIRDTGVQLLAEMASQDNWQDYYAPTISRINDRLLEWYEVGESAEREVALDVIRTKMQSQCGKVASSDQDATTCSNFLVRAGRA
jgi:thioredoxin-related protein/tetratricopeptide (TPR) repeat protein